MEKRRKKKYLLRILPVLLLILTVYSVISLWVSTNLLTVRRFTAEVGADNPVRTVVISDLHDHEFGENNEKLAEKIRRIRPDLILMAGDMLNAESRSADVPLTLIRELKDTAPIYYALGNHEIGYMENGHPELTEQLEEAGAVVLDKEYKDLDAGGTQIRLGGMYDYAFGLNGNNDAMSAPGGTLHFLEDFQDTDRLKIMISHRPDSFIFGDASKVWKVDLVISGHNHGGQVVLPFLGGLYGGDQGFFPEYIHGMYKKDNLRMFVTSGLGSDRQKLPRFNNPPEIAVLELR